MKRERTTLRFDDNLRARILILAAENKVSFNKMAIYLLELGYNEYMLKFNEHYKHKMLEVKRNEKH